MPQFFFHIHNDIDSPDDEGLELPNLEAARTYAVKCVRDLIGETVAHKGQIRLSHRIDVEDENGRVLDTVRFGEAVTIKP
jgi:hypothetical protein